MAGKFSRSWSLVKASAAVLRADKKLLVFPLLSGLCALIVTASFFVPAMLSGLFAQLGDGGSISPLALLVAFAFYLVQYFVMFFFSSALVGAAMMRLRGEEPTLADGLRIAAARWPAILGYAAIAATVGLILRALQERAGFIGRWVIGLIGLAWTVATFLTVPVLVNENVGPVDAVKRSASLLRQTWGENLIGTTGMGLVFALIMVPLVLIGVGLVTVAAPAQSFALTAMVIALIAMALLVLGLLQAALQGIYAAALYRYAAEGDAGAGFDPALLTAAFRVKA